MQTDVTFVFQDKLIPTIDTFPYLVQKLKQAGACRLRFAFKQTKENENVCALENCNLTVIKTSEDNWNFCIASDVPLNRLIEYFEIQINGKRTSHHDGSYVGVTDDITMALMSLGYVNTDTTCALYDSKTGNFLSQKHVLPEVTTNTKEGDIIGVVVDRREDKILFYKNGEFLTFGRKRPSHFSALYVFVSTYYKDTSFTAVNKYEYTELKKPEMPTTIIEPTENNFVKYYSYHKKIE
jgi:hypothetical protein